jgi:hypothetical protein
MPVKAEFETTIPFTEVPGEGWFPIVEVTFIKADGQRRPLLLLFDTGATEIVLRPEFDWLFPPGRRELWDTAGAGQGTPGVLTAGKVEFLGITTDCNISLLPMRPRLWAGLFGRECFSAFGFGFWERSRRLYVTAKP